MWKVEERGKLSLGARVLTWSPAEWEVVCFLELENARTGEA